MASLFQKPLQIMGICNVTPDSFFDGGQYNQVDAAVTHIKKLIAQGADMIDIGAASTRPGAAILTPQEEWERLAPVLQRILPCAVPISVDTFHAEVMEKALNSGVSIINDISGFSFDPASRKIIARYQAHVVLMHMQGQPDSMQNNPQYQDVVAEVYDFLKQKRDQALVAGIKPCHIALDPGIGFGKNLQHNLDILKSLQRFQSLNCPLLLGLSRKSFIHHITGSCPDPQDRLPGSLTALVLAAQAGGQIFRVHDVAETRQALQVFAAIKST